MNICMTGCTSYVGQVIYNTLMPYDNIECITHDTTFDTIKEYDALIHVGWLCDNESLKLLQSHISNIRYALRILKYIKATKCIFISSIGAKWSYMFKQIKLGQILYNLSKRFMENLYKLHYKQCLILRLPYVYDQQLKPGSIAYRMKYNNVKLNEVLPFVTSKTIANFILRCLNDNIFKDTTVELVDLYAKTWSELDAYLKRNLSNLL